MLFAHILKLGISENKRQNYAFHHFISKNPWWFQNKVVYLRSKRNVAAMTHKIINGMARYIDPTCGLGFQAYFWERGH